MRSRLPNRCHARRVRVRAIEEPHSPGSGRNRRAVSPPCSSVTSMPGRHVREPERVVNASGGSLAAWALHRRRIAGDHMKTAPRLRARTLPRRPSAPATPSGTQRVVSSSGAATRPTGLSLSSQRQGPSLPAGCARARLIEHQPKHVADVPNLRPHVRRQITDQTSSRAPVHAIPAAGVS